MMVGADKMCRRCLLRRSSAEEGCSSHASQQRRFPKWRTPA